MSAFNQLINSGQPVLVDFYAEWCGPCKAMAPVLKELAPKINGKARIIKVDVDKNPAASAQYGIKGVPTFILFKDGEIKWKQSGAVPAHELLNVILKFV